MRRSYLIFAVVAIPYPQFEIRVATYVILFGRPPKIYVLLLRILFESCCYLVRLPGVEPGPDASKAPMLP